MNSRKLFTTVLDFGESWRVDSVIESPHEPDSIEINVSYVKPKGVVLYDHQPERRWRHLDFFQYKSYITCRLPRIEGSDGEITTLSPPWAKKLSRHTFQFECHVINLLLASKNQTATARIARCGFYTVNRIIHNSVQRGLIRRKLSPRLFESLSIDEKAFQKGHKYISVLSNPTTGVILDVEEERTVAATQSLLDRVLTPTQQRAVKSISMDMWKAYLSTAKRVLPNARITHDRFHLVKYLNSAVDHVRRREVKTNKEILTNSRYALLKNPENLTEKQRLKFNAISKTNLGVSRAWQARENFKAMFGEETTKEAGRALFKQWASRSVDAATREVTKVVRVFENHEDGVVNSLIGQANTAMAERLNGKIQMLKTVSRGYRTFENFRSAIMFFNGGLDLYPQRTR